ncbi:MAG: glycosyltransferase [Lachnospiraceae bacterium]|jgi:glycosyltransferase involved in cell wall biosynthesis|nr:glycosyltransferase [Lachnospiraceae bacterium]
MPKIAVFISSLHKSGAERVAANLIDYLADAGWDVMLVTQQLDPDEYTLQHDVPRYISDIEGAEITGSRLVNLVRRYRKLSAVWKSGKPDLILSFIGKNNVMAMATSGKYRIPCVVSVRGNPAREYADPRVRREAFRLFPKAAGVILQTERAAEYFPDNIRRRAVVLPNPLNPRFLRPLREGARSHVILSVGRLDANKNQAMMIDAFARIRTRFPDYTLELLGDGEDREKLAAKIAADGLAGSVFLRGSVDDVPERLEKASLCLLTSNSEGLPNALIEAMALGVPCIATDCPCGGPAYLFRGGTCGLLVPCGDTEALAGAMEKVLSDPALAARLSQNGLYVRESFSPDGALAAWEKYLRSALDKGRNAQAAHCTEHDRTGRMTG